MTSKPVTFDELDPPPRLLMGPGPINAYPRVLRAQSAQLLGQYDPAFTAYMNEVMALYRQVFVTDNQWTFLIDGTARSAIEAVLVSLIEPGDRVLVPVFGRFGLLLKEIAERCDADVRLLEVAWGTVVDPAAVEAAILEHDPKLIAICQGDTSTTMCQPLKEIGAIARKHDRLVYVDATASICGNALPVDDFQLDAVTVGLQKCMGGPSGVAPITLNERAVAVINQRKHIEAGIRSANDEAGRRPRIRSNYFDLAMIMDYWSEKRLNHHTEATTMLYSARECARIVLQEGLDACIDRHRLASDAMVAGLSAMELRLFGDLSHKMNNVTGVYIPDGVVGDAVRADLLNDYGIEIGTSFGPLHGKIWRIGTMGYNCRKQNVLITLNALEATLRAHGVTVPAGAGTDAALAVYRTAEARLAQAAE